MNNGELIAITGAFGYTGKYITRRLLSKDKKVITLTGHPNRPNEFGDEFRAVPFNFDRPEHLTESLRGVTTLYNTYWIRFDHGEMTFDRAVKNTRTLIQSAEDAGVRRFIHVSITNPSPDSTLPYFRGKGLLEQAIKESKLSYTIIRPTVIFGLEDILINNIAYLLRRFPIFVIPGSGEYRLQPIYVEDMADIAVQAGESSENQVIDAVGPDIFTFNDLVILIAEEVGRRPKIIHLPPSIPLTLSHLIGIWMKDVVLTEDEIKGLSADLLISHKPPTGHTRLGDWLEAHAEQIGSRYASELERHYSNNNGATG